MAGPAATAQVHPSVKRGGEPCVAGYHQCQTTGATDAGEIAAERCPARVTVVAQHDTGKAAGQPRDGRPGVRQAARIGEQPERGDVGREALAGMGPREQPPIHRAMQVAVLTGRRT